MVGLAWTPTVLFVISPNSKFVKKSNSTATLYGKLYPKKLPIYVLVFYLFQRLLICERASPPPDSASFPSRLLWTINTSPSADRSGPVHVVRIVKSSRNPSIIFVDCVGYAAPI